ncbi:MAG: hypothetical protein J7M14_01110 [Planctomycetes bacterium]|nr:hypothetical protein [Planctomycetota bacterium]
MTKSKEGNLDKASRGQERRGSERRRGERRSVVDRRANLERRRGPGRRRSDDRRSAEEGEMNPEQFEFIMAMNEYKRINNRPFPSWTEVLDVIKALGYRKMVDPTDIT